VGSPAVEDLVAHLAAIHDEFAFQFYEAQDCYKDYADRTRKIHPNFHIWGLRVAFTTKYKNKTTIKKAGLSTIGSIQNYCTNKSS
jgi:hypothetical protein